MNFLFMNKSLFKKGLRNDINSMYATGRGAAIKKRTEPKGGSAGHGERNLLISILKSFMRFVLIHFFFRLCGCSKIIALEKFRQTVC